MPSASYPLPNSPKSTSLIGTVTAMLALPADGSSPVTSTLLAVPGLVVQDCPNTRHGLSRGVADVEQSRVVTSEGLDQRIPWLQLPTSLPAAAFS